MAPFMNFTRVGKGWRLRLSGDTRSPAGTGLSRQTGQRTQDRAGRSLRVRDAGRPEAGPPSSYPSGPPLPFSCGHGLPHSGPSPCPWLPSLAVQRQLVDRVHSPTPPLPAAFAYGSSCKLKCGPGCAVRGWDPLPACEGRPVL